MVVFLNATMMPKPSRASNSTPYTNLLSDLLDVRLNNELRCKCALLMRDRSLFCLHLHQNGSRSPLAVRTLCRQTICLTALGQMTSVYSSMCIPCDLNKVETTKKQCVSAFPLSLQHMSMMHRCWPSARIVWALTTSHVFVSEAVSRQT